MPALDAEAAAPSPERPAPSYKKKAIEAASFVIIGFGLSQVIRLAGNIVLTRLLAPELFGLVTLARVFVTGLYLFSDVGLEPAIIRNERSNDPVFLNTAWTIQILRSAILAAISCAIAWPVAAAYGQPILAAVIPVIGLFSMAGGFQSTSLTKMDRELQQKKLTIMELIIQVISIVCMIVAAFFFRNIWALLLGDFIGSIIRTVWSHALNKAHPNAWRLEGPAVKSILSFGKWILVSTAMYFLASQADRILLGKFFTITWFGIYSIAVNLAELPKQVIQRLSQKVLFPLITKYIHYPREVLRQKIGKPRGKVLIAVAILLAAFACFGDVAVRIIFDQRYQAACWILPLLAIGMWPLLLIMTIDASLLSVGKPIYAALGSIAKVIFMVAGIPIGFRLGGVLGAVLVVVVNDVPSWVVINVGLAREGLSQLKQDCLATLVLFGSAALLILIRLGFGLGFPGQAEFLLGH